MSHTILFACTVIVAAGAWRQQLGTVQHPKVPGQWPYARRGDVIRFNEQLYVAKQTLDLTTDKQLSPEHVERLLKGSVRYPKQMRDSISAVGEIFHDSAAHAYYRAECLGDKAACLHPVSLNANWMSLLRDIIGDLKLGDIFLPGSHDAATEGCDLDSYLVDQNFLFELGGLVTPQVMVNWSRTQEDDLDAQLEAGFRYFDLRIADMDAINETFFWWHGITADEIFQGLEMIRDFATAYPEEVLILDFGHFAAMGDEDNRVLPIPEHRMDELADIMLEYLSDVLVNSTLITTNNPTVNEILATGSNAIAIVSEEYIRDKSDLFWSSFINYRYSGVTNPEDLFNSRSADLIHFQNNNPDDVTMLSGCVTPDEKIVVAGLSIEFGDSFLLDRILDQLFLNRDVEVQPELMSFEGLWVDIVSMARRGVNTAGMHARDPAVYSTGASAPYSGTNDIYRYWLARPDKYKTSILFDDDVTVSSNLVELSIASAMGEIKREVSITYQGTPTHGFYNWVNFTAIGGDEAYNCVTLQVRVSVSTGVRALDATSTYTTPFQTVFIEGQYPVNSSVLVEVSSSGEDWVAVYTGDIQTMIESNGDLHMRGVAEGDGGLVYLCDADAHDLHGPQCDTPPDAGYLTLIQW